MKCKFCNHNKLEKINTFIQNKYNTTMLPLDDYDYKTTVSVCLNCGLGININPLSSEELNKIYKNYFYFTSYFDNITRNYFKDININFFLKHISNANAKIVEIGCHDGHLLDLLQKNTITGGGYKYLMGIEPSSHADIGILHGLNIEKAFFKENYFHDKVDIFISRNTFEHFEEPFLIFENMIAQLSDNGVIIIETPDFTGYDPTHMYFFSWPFYEKMAQKYGMKIIDTITTYYKVWNCYTMTLAFVKINNTNPQKRCPYNMQYVIENEKKNILIEKQRFFDECRKIEKFLSNKDRIYWIGTNGYAISFLKMLYLLKVSCDIIPADRFDIRNNYKLPYTKHLVKSLKILQNSHVQGIVLWDYTKDEVCSILSEYKITYDELFPIDFMI